MLLFHKYFVCGWYRIKLLLDKINELVCISITWPDLERQIIRHVQFNCIGVTTNVLPSYCSVTAHISFMVITVWCWDMRLQTRWYKLEFVCLAGYHCLTVITCWWLWFIYWSLYCIKSKIATAITSLYVLCIPVATLQWEPLDLQRKDILRQIILLLNLVQRKRVGWCNCKYKKPNLFHLH